MIAADKKLMQSGHALQAPSSKTYYKHARTQPVPEWGRLELTELERLEGKPTV